MNIDLLLDLDDDLIARVETLASVTGVSYEEFLRRALMEGAGRKYEALDLSTLAHQLRPVVHLDLRT